MNLVPVRDQTDQGIELYNIFTLPPEEIQNKIAEGIINKIEKFNNNQDLNILDIGIGNGWLILSIIKVLLKKNFTKKIDIIGIDTSNKWLKELKINVDKDESLKNNLNIEKTNKEKRFSLYLRFIRLMRSFSHASYKFSA
jgi:tRNA G46 methylase TrmB